MKPSKTLTALLLSTALLSGCGESIPNKTEWKEEVLLSDGTKIWVKRTVIGTAKFSGGIGAGRTFEATEQKLEVVDSAGLSTPPIWNDQWEQMILDRDKDGIWYIVITPIDTREWRKRVSKLPYAQFKAINGKWTQVEIDRSLDGRDVNLEPIFKVGKMPKVMPLSDKPYRKKLGYDAPAIAPQYRYVNLDLKYW